MKVLTKLVAVSLAAAGIATLAGCTKKTVTAYTATTPNWNVRTSNAVENDSVDFWTHNKEVCTYSVTSEGGINKTYSVSYSDGEYITRFYMKQFNWATDTLDGYKSEESKVENIYVYETELSINATFTFGDGSGENAVKQFSDKTVSTCYFRMAKENLQPIYSYQKIKNATPAALTAANADQMCEVVEAEFTTYYNQNCSEAAVITKKGEDEASPAKYISLANKQGYSTFDNSQIRAAMRSFTLTGGTNRTFNVLVPQNQCAQTCYATVSGDAALNAGDEKQIQIIRAMSNADKNYIFFNYNPAEGEEVQNMRYTAVNLSLSAEMSGPSVSQWYAKVENSGLNSTRSVLLRTTSNLAFGLGKLDYVLSTVALESI